MPSDKLFRFHLKQRRLFVRWLRKQGIGSIEVVEEQNVQYDLIISGVRIALRFARASPRRHRSIWKGKWYYYNYQVYHFNFQSHNEIISKDVDLVFCVLSKNGRRDFFCIPRTRITGMSFPLHCSNRGKKYRGKYAPLRSTLTPLRELVKHKRARRKRAQPP